MSIAVRSSSRISGATPPEPAGAASGDILVAFATGLPGMGIPAGWGGGVSALFNSSGSLLLASTIIRGGSAPSLTWTGTVFEVQVIAFTGVDQATWEDVAGVASPNNATSTTPTSPSITTATDNAQLAVALANANNTATITVPASFNQDQNSTGNGIACADLVQATHGASGTKQWTLSTTDLTGTVTLALRPAAADTLMGQQCI